MLVNFELFCTEHGVDIASTKPADEPKLAHAVHDFVTGAVHGRAEVVKRLRDAGEPDAPVTIHTVPADPIRRRINQHYTDFGLDRRAKSKELRAAEEKVLERQKRHVFAKILLQDDLGPDMPKDEAASMARYVKYPEISIVMQLRDACHDKGYLLATDGAEVVQAAYGQRFMDLVSYGDLIIENSTGERRHVQRVNTADIDEEFQAENWRGIRGKRSE
jgi:hypothetical protein